MGGNTAPRDRRKDAMTTAIAATEIKISEDGLGWDGERLATLEEYLSGSRDIGSIFEALSAGEVIALDEGSFVLDEDLDPIVNHV
jgi:hypothetical protein